jgi:hypothetical protein
MRSKGAAPRAGHSGRAASTAGRQRLLKIIALVDMDVATPRELRDRFIDAVRQAVTRAWACGRIDLAEAEELIRALPARGRA